MVRPPRSVCTLLAVAVLAAGCGGGDDDPAGRSDPAAAADAALSNAEAEPNLDVTGDGTTSTTTSTTVTSTSTTTTTIPGIVVDENLLGIDECFNRVDTLTAGRNLVITTLVDCADPHAFQIFSNLQYPAEGGVLYPGDDIMEDFALASCYRRFEAWAGSASETSALEIRVFAPDRREFEEQDYRRILCYVERRDREPLIGTARGAGL